LNPTGLNIWIPGGSYSLTLEIISHPGGPVWPTIRCSAWLRLIRPDTGVITPAGPVPGLDPTPAIAGVGIYTFNAIGPGWWTPAWRVHWCLLLSFDNPDLLANHSMTLRMDAMTSILRTPAP
jgi:hypothetical protein